MLCSVALLISLYDISPDFSRKKQEISKGGLCPIQRFWLLITYFSYTVDAKSIKQIFWLWLFYFRPNLKARIYHQKQGLLNCCQNQRCSISLKCRHCTCPSTKRIFPPVGFEPVFRWFVLS